MAPVEDPALYARIADRMGAKLDGDTSGHDLHRVVGEGFVHPRETLPTVREILADAAYPHDVEAVCHAVAVHEEYDFDYGHGDERGTETLEADVLQDADNLDALGAVGVARAFAFAGAHDQLIHDVDPSPEWVPWEDDAEGGTIDHFRAKLLELRGDMNTETARRIADERHAFLVTFLERFEREWPGAE